MRFAETQVAGALRIDIEPHRDVRGYFARTYCVEEFRAAGIDKPFVQDSIGFNEKTGTLRGLHFHAPGFPQTRLVRCVSGSIFAVVVDLREDSSSFLRHEGFELSQANQVALFVPPGVALGYQTLEPATTVYYQMSELYDPAQERGVRWNDPAFDIEWPSAERTMLDRDAEFPVYSREAGTR